jgi:hypothetical protein
MNKVIIESRIALLKSRPKENENVIKKLERKLRNIEKHTEQND